MCTARKWQNKDQNLGLCVDAPAIFLRGTFPVFLAFLGEVSSPLARLAAAPLFTN